ncbi:hypothetical protein UY3_03288 [Chelonia mydas]|uniref:Uncharacterized protein n=1 Tax=Chelonia mydas TaxID=8469 RepID=M7CF58_CHEMY|nr:hypothetical protein UY3_03288 [Chelonia mydas]
MWPKTASSIQTLYHKKATKIIAASSNHPTNLLQRLFLKLTLGITYQGSSVALKPEKGISGKLDGAKIGARGATRCAGLDSATHNGLFSGRDCSQDKGKAIKKSSA